MSILSRVRELAGTAIVRFGLKVAGFDPVEMAVEPEPEPEELTAAVRVAGPAPEVELSPRARAMVDEARAETERLARAQRPVEEPSTPRRGSLAWRRERAAARGS